MKRNKFLIPIFSLTKLPKEFWALAIVAVREVAATVRDYFKTKKDKK